MGRLDEISGHEGTSKAAVTHPWFVVVTLAVLAATNTVVLPFLDIGERRGRTAEPA